MPAQRLTFDIPAEDGEAFQPDVLIDEVILTGQRLADGAVVVNADLLPHDESVKRVAIDIYT